MDSNRPQQSFNIEPVDPVGERMATGLQTIFYNGLTLGSIFAGFTLNAAVSIPDYTSGDLARWPSARWPAAIAAILWSFSALLCFGGSVLVALNADDMRRGQFARKSGWYMYFLVTLIMQIVSPAIIFSFAVLVPYTPKFGCFATLIVFLGLVPLHWQLRRVAWRLGLVPESQIGFWQALRSVPRREFWEAVGSELR